MMPGVPFPGGGLARRTLLRALAALPFLAMSAPASAQVYTVGARTEAQAYQMPSWAGRPADDPDKLSVYEIAQYLDLGAYNLAGSKGEDRIDFVASLRLTYDFGFTPTTQNLLDPESSQPQVDLLFGYLRWTGALKGIFDLQLGRQVRMDLLEFYGLDGLDVQIHTPAYLGVGLFGGWQVKGSSPLGSATFAPDGVRTSDRRRIANGSPTDLLANPASDVAYDYLDAPSPMFGARLELEGVRNVEAIAVYRRSMSKTRGDNLDALPEQARGWQTDQEHAGAGGRVRFFERLWLYGSADRDLFRNRWAVLRGGVKADVVPYKLTLMLEGSTWNPSFDADSIWNLFATGPRDEYELRADWAISPYFTIYAGPLLTIYYLNLGTAYADEAGVKAQGMSLLPGGYAGFSTRPNLPWRLGADALYRGPGGGNGEPGNPDYLGHELWLSAAAGRSFRDKYDLDLRLNLANVSDPYSPGLQDVWSFGAALLGRARLSEITSLVLVVEENVNRFKDSDLRGYALLDVRTAFE